MGVSFDDILTELKSQIYEENISQKFSDSDEPELEHDHDDSEIKSTAEDKKNDISKVEITQEVYFHKFNEIRNAYWQVQLEVHDEYNFGLTLLDCKHFKQHIVKTLAYLMQKFENHLNKDFAELLNDLWDKNQKIWDRITQVHDDIDMTIAQMEYIEAL